MTTALLQDEHIQVGNGADWRHRAEMACGRCGGLMVSEDYSDLPARRCVQCGDFIDPVILQNRLRSMAAGSKVTACVG
jgi:hypothetical protein